MACVALGSAACFDVTPRDRTPQKLAAYFSDLPVPDTAKVLEFKEEFAEGPAGRGQGVVLVTLELDSTAFEVAMASALKQGTFLPVSSFDRPKRGPLSEAPDGIYYLVDDYNLSHDLIVLNPARRTLHVGSATLSGLP